MATTKRRQRGLKDGKRRKIYSMLFGNNSGGGRSSLLDGAPFRAGLMYSAVPEMAASGTTATFTRATASTWKNNDGYMVTGVAGEIGFVGARRVRNLIAGSSENLANASWASLSAGTGSAATATSGFTDPDGGTGAYRIQANRGAGVTAGDYSIYRNTCSAAGNFRQVWVKSNTGSSQTFTLWAAGTGSVKTATTTWTLISDKTTASGALFDFANYGPSGTTQSLDILVWHPQCEDITGRADQTTPSEYVSVGALDYRSELNRLYLSLPGTAGHYASTPDSGTRLPNNYTILVKLRRSDWTTVGEQQILTKYSYAENKRAWTVGFDGSGLRTRISSSGTAATIDKTGGAPTVNDGDLIWLRYKYTKDTGAGQYEITHSQSSDGSNWTVISTFTGVSTGDNFVSDSVILLGAVGSLATNAGNLAGFPYEVQAYDHNNDLVLDFNPHRDATTPTGTITSSTTGEVWTINGASSVVRSDYYHGSFVDGVKCFPTYLSTQNFASFPGTAGSYIYTADSTANSITGDIDIQIKCAPVDWTPAVANRFVTKGTARQYDFYLKAGGNLAWYDAYNNVEKPSTAIVSFADGATGWVRVTRDAATGTFRFYTRSGDTDSWTQLGADVAGTAGSTTDTSNPLYLGIYYDLTSTPFNGKIYQADIYDEIGGTTPVVSFDAENYARGLVSSDTGETWIPVGLVNFVQQQEGSPLPTEYTYDAVSLNGVAGTYVSTPDSVAASITGDIDIRVKAALTDWTPTGETRLVSKSISDAAGFSYLFRIAGASTDNLQFYYTTNGTTLKLGQSSVGVGFVDGSTHWLRATLAVATGDVTFYTCPSEDGITWVQLGSTRSTTAGAIFDSTAEVGVGAGSSGAQGPLNGKIYRAQIYNGINGTLAVDFDASRYAGGTTLTGSTGETWTLKGNAVIHPTNNPMLGYQAEGARTNLCLQSNAFTTTWSAVGTPSATQNAIGPDGGTTAWALTDNDAASAEGISQSLGALTAASYTYSLLVKKTSGATSFPVLQMYTVTGPKGAFCTVDTNNGVATVWTAYTGITIVTSSATCRSFDANFWRVSLTFTATTDAWLVQFYPAVTTNATQSTGVYDAATQGSAVFYGAQVELGAFASPYIATTTIAVARNADVLAYSGGDIANLKTLSASFRRESGISDAGYILSLTDGTANNFSAMQLTSATNYQARGDVGGVQQWGIASNTYSAGSIAKSAVSWATNNVTSAFNGVALTADTSASVPTVTSLNVGHIAGAAHLFGTTRGLYGWTRNLSQSEEGAVAT